MRAAGKTTVGARKTYTQPRLVVKGDIGKLTLSCNNKDLGPTDGLLFQGQSINFSCS